MLIAGVDEVGRGPLAGPVVAAAVVYPKGYSNSEIRDSKQLSAKKREQLIDLIKSVAVDWAIVAVGPRRIEGLNIRSASRLAMSLAVRRLRIAPDLVLVDGNMEIDTDLPQETVIHGDSLHVEISAASIVAKVYRDRLMVTLAEHYPGYGFEKHAGYPTVTHRQAIERLGPSRAHRRTFRGVSEFTNRQEILAPITELQH